MGPVERFVVMQALYSAIGEQVRTGRPDNLRGAVSESYRQAYELTGGTSFDIRLDGVKVGTFSFEKDKGEQGYEEQVLAVTDTGELLRWMRELPPERLLSYIVDKRHQVASDWLAETGEVPPGCAVETREGPPKPAGIKGNGRVRIDAAKVAEVLGSARLGDAVAGFLGEARDG